MTDKSMALEAPVGRTGASPDCLRETLTYMLQELMEYEATGLCEAERHARSAERSNQRNGDREGALEPRRASE